MKGAEKDVSFIYGIGNVDWGPCSVVWESDLGVCHYWNVTIAMNLYIHTFKSTVKGAEKEVSFI